jgi:fibronectin type 3 domain-containing protein
MAGVTVNNAFAGDITGKVTTAGGDIDTSTPGIYLVKYQISDTIIADGTPYDVSYTDYRWIGVTEAMPQSAGDPLVITDGIIEVGASSSEASLTQDGKAIAYTNVLTEEGKYTISASVSESSGTTGVAFSGIAPDVQHAVALMGPPSQTSRRVILEASDTRGIETTFAGTGTTAPGTKSAMLMIDREGPVYSPRCYINSDTNITVQANAQDVAGIGVTKWAKGEQSVSFFAIGGTEFSGSFQADSYGKYTIYARDTLGNESAEVVNIQAVAAPSSVQVTADFSGGNTSRWGGVAGVSGYQVWRSVTADGTYECLAETAARKYTDTAVTPRQTYYYIVRAYKTSGSMRIYSAASRMVSAAAVYTTPEGVSASMASYNSVTVSWNPVDGASGYQLYRATSENGTYSLVKTTTATSYANTSLKTGTRYYYKVRAYRTVNRRKVFGSDSAVVSATPVLSPVAAASAVAYYPTSIKVTWSSVPGRTKYEVWRADSPGGTPVLVKTTTSTYYKDTTRTPFVTYYYFIKVYRSVSGSKVYAGSASPTVSATPTLGNVANVRAAVSSASSVKVSWSAVTGASGYEVWRCDTTDGAYTLVKSTSGKSYTDKNLIPNKTYYYQVVAYRKVGTVHVCSTPCSPVSAMPYLGPVTNAAAVRSSATAIKLTWSAVSGRTGYEIYRSTSLTGVCTDGTATGTSYSAPADRGHDVFTTRYGRTARSAA